MTNYQINLTQAQDKALSFAASSQNDWIQNAIATRCELAIDEIVKITVAKCLETSLQIPSSKDEMVELAFSQGWVESAAERQARFEAEAAARAAEQTQGA